MDLEREERNERRLREIRREETASRILAALLNTSEGITWMEHGALTSAGLLYVQAAVRITDALRMELAKR